MPNKRIPIENKTFGRYHVIEYAGYDSNKKGAFYLCIDMIDGKRKVLRQDNLIPIEKNFKILCKEIKKIENYKKQHKLK